MKQGFFRVTENRPLTNPGGGGQIFLMKLEGDTQAITRPGQFVNLKIDGLYLRRPISVCDCEGDTLTLIYRVVGKGTERMAAGCPRRPLRPSDGARQRIRYTKERRPSAAHRRRESASLRSTCSQKG